LGVVVERVYERHSRRDWTFCGTSHGVDRSSRPYWTLPWCVDDDLSVVDATPYRLLNPDWCLAAYPSC
jgi:hypothetical protein